MAAAGGDRAVPLFSRRGMGEFPAPCGREDDLCRRSLLERYADDSYPRRREAAEPADGEILAAEAAGAAGDAAPAQAGREEVG